MGKADTIYSVVATEKSGRNKKICRGMFWERVSIRKNTRKK